MSPWPMRTQANRARKHGTSHILPSADSWVISPAACRQIPQQAEGVWWSPLEAVWGVLRCKRYTDAPTNVKGLPAGLGVGSELRWLEFLIVLTLKSGGSDMEWGTTQCCWMWFAGPGGGMPQPPASHHKGLTDGGQKTTGPTGPTSRTKGVRRTFNGERGPSVLALPQSCPPALPDKTGTDPPERKGHRTDDSPQPRRSACGREIPLRQCASCGGRHILVQGTATHPPCSVPVRPAVRCFGQGPGPQRGQVCHHATASALSWPSSPTV